MTNQNQSNLLFAKYTEKKGKKQTQYYQLQKVNLNMEHWLGNTE